MRGGHFAWKLGQAPRGYHAVRSALLGHRRAHDALGMALDPRFGQRVIVSKQLRHTNVCRRSSAAAGGRTTRPSSVMHGRELGVTGTCSLLRTMRATRFAKAGIP